MELPLSKKILKYSVDVLLLIILAIACVSIIFYASGYRINFKAKKIQKTGLLIIDYKEDNLQIFIDNKKVKGRKNVIPSVIPAPYSIALLPGEYNLLVKKEGKVSYQERFKINPELITRVDDVILFPEKPEEHILLEKEIEKWSLSPDNKKMVYADNKNDIYIYDLDKNEDKKIAENVFFQNKTISSYTWDKDSKRVLIILGESKSFFNYMLDGNSPKNSFFLHEKLSFAPFLEKIFFSERNTSDLFGVAGGVLYSVKLSSGMTTALEKNISDLTQDHNYLYYYKKDLSQLMQFDTNISKATIIEENMTRNGDFDILPLNNSKNIYFQNGGKVFFVEDKNTLTTIDENVIKIFPSRNNRSFYYTKGLELWSYDDIKKERLLITRFSNNIQDIQEYYDINYLLYATENSVGIIKRNGANNTIIKNNTKTESVANANKNQILLVEKKDKLKSFKVLDL